MNPKVSIILPVYNTGEILRNTIESIRNQTYDSFELLLIDDGSTDLTPNICEEYVSLDKRIKYIRKTNGGTCSARNLGIDVSVGEFITFCDHDDIYEPNILEEEIHLAEKTESKVADLVIVGASHVYDDGSRLKYGMNFKLDSKQAVSDNYIWIIKNHLLDTVWNILYRRELIGESRFDESMKKGSEDIVFNFEIIKKVQCIAGTDDLLYKHYIRKSMSTSAGYHAGALDAILKTSEALDSFFCKLNRDNVCIDYLNLKGDYMKTFATYCHRVNSDYEFFKEKMNLLVFKRQPIDLIYLLKNFNKNTFTFFCFEKKYWRMLYAAIKVFGR